MTRSIAWIAVLVIGAPALADVPNNAPPQNDTLQTILDRIRTHAASHTWEKEGWKDEAIEAYLDKLLATIAAATQSKDLKLPVRLADVRPLKPAVRPPVVQDGVLVIGKDLKLTGSIRNSIVFADGSVELHTVPDACVIVARHAIVGRSITRNCVLVAGNHFATLYDGDSTNPNVGSVIVSGGTAHIYGSYGSIIAAGDEIRTDSCLSSIFVNSEIRGRDRGGSRSVRVPGLILEEALAHPLSSKIKVLGVVNALPLPAKNLRRLRDPDIVGVIFRIGDRRHLATVGEPIVDDAGIPVEALKGWQLSFATDRIAIFRNGDADAVVRIEGK